MSSVDSPSLDDVRATNWIGCIPVCLTLAPTSVSSPTIPPPVHVLVPRHSYLHVGLQTAVQRLHRFAPVSPLFSGTSVLQISEPDPGGREEKGDLLDMSTKIAESGAAFQSEKMLTAPNDSYPICWFEDEDTNLPVRWHLFAGILFDFKKPNVSSGSSSNATLPWKLKLHFTNYPGFTQMILPLEHPVLTNVQASYKHSLKQAMTIASGNSRSAMNVTKESHGLLWEAVRLNSFVFYQRADVLPLSSTTKTVVAIPVRVLVNGSSPPMQQRVEGSETITLGELLNQWLPHLFADQTPPSNGLENGTDKDNADGDTAELGVTSTNTVLCWKVSGVQPPLSMSLMELWTKCAYPDQFLYVIVLTR